MPRTHHLGAESIPETSDRPLLWWRVPERPGVGAAMLKNAVVWLGSIIVLLVIVEALT